MLLGLLSEILSPESSLILYQKSSLLANFFDKLRPGFAGGIIIFGKQACQFRFDPCAMHPEKGCNSA